MDLFAYFGKDGKSKPATTTAILLYILTINIRKKQSYRQSLMGLFAYFWEE